MLRLIGLVIVAAWVPLGEVDGQSLTQELEYPRDQPQLPLTLPPPAYLEGAQVDAHVGDSLALVKFYNSTGGSSTWTNRTGWLEGPVSQWHGIALTNQGRVIRITLASNGLSGPLPTDLGLLTELEVLYLGRNSLTGTIPPELGNLTKLKRLELNNNDLSGGLPTDLGLLTELEFLNLGENSLTGTIPSELGNLTKLTWLQLLVNDLSGPIPSELGRLTELKRLWLGNNDLTGTIPSELGNLTKLTWLHLTANVLSGPVPTQLGLLTELEYLHLSSNGLTGTIPSELGNLTKLKQLTLGSNNLSGVIPPELGNLSNLNWLGLDSNRISGAIPPEIGNLSKLRWLDLDDNNLSGSIPPQLGQLTELIRLSLHDNDLSGAIPPELGNLGKLTRLSLSYNNLSGALPKELGNLVELTYLFLYNNALSGPIPTELGNLARLVSLWLYNNSFSGPIPKEFGQLSSLRQLRLQNNALSGPIPTELAQLESLVSIYVHDNQLSGIVPDLTGLSQLDKVRVQDNQFLFADLLPNADLSSLEEFNYAPQDSINTQLTCEGSEYVFSTPATAQGNKFKWYRDGEEIASEQKNTLRVSASSTGQYHASITNDALQDLTLYSRKTSTNSIAPCETRQFAHVGDSLALVELYNSTQGNGWTTKTGWLQAPVSEWYGITLSNEGRVTNVALGDNKLTGPLPKEIGDLDSLQVLALADNVLSGSVPNLTSLKQLGSVRVQDNRFLFKDLLPNATFSPASGFTYAPQDSIDTQLTCDGTEYVFTTPATAQGNAYKWYRNGEVIGNEQTNTLRINASSTGQYHASVTNNALQDLTLYSRKTSTSSIAPCQTRQFAHKGDSLVLVELYNSTKGNEWTRNTGWLQTPVSEWFGITLDADGRVTGVDLESNNLVGQLPESMGTLAKLDSLLLPRNSLFGPIPPKLGQLKELRELWLSFNRLSGAVPAELSQMSKLEELAMTGNQLTGHIPPELGQLANLKYLWLASNRLSGTIPSELRHLEKISVNANNLSGPIPTHLGEWANLIELHLCDNNFTGPIPAQVGQLSELEFLCLRNNQLSGAIPTELNQLSKLKTLWLHENHLSGPVPNLTSLNQLSSVRLQDNRFLFADLLPNAALNPASGFTYAPQDSINTQLTCEGSQYVFTTPATAQGNAYKWYRDGEEIANEQTNTLRVSASSTGQYHASITNDALQDLTLYSRKTSTSSIAPCETRQFAHVGDSLALVKLYNSTKGSAWTTRTGWLQGPVSGWHGITLSSEGRVTNVALSENNLEGSLPEEIEDLDSLRVLALADNVISGLMPNLTSLKQLGSVRVQDNRFLFKDLLPNATFNPASGFTYAPQDSIDTQLTCDGTEYVFTTPATAQGNAYKWYRNGEEIGNEQTNTLRVSASSTGQYHASVTNSRLQDLTLYSRKTSTSSSTPCQNSAPTIVNAIADQTIAVGGTYSVDLTTVFSDPDNDVLTFAAISGDEATATAAISNNTLTVTGVAVGTATITVSATDTQGSNTKVEDSFTVTVTSSNSPPTIVNAIADQTIAVGGTYSVDLTTVFSDPDNDVLTFAANSGDVATATATISNNTLTVTGEAVGSATITVSATDTQGSNTKVEDAFTVTVTSNSPPTIASAIADQTIAVGDTYSVDLTTVFSDPDNDVLTFAAISGDEATATATISNSTLTVTGVAVGSATITVSATDTQGSNTKVEDSFTVTVTSTARQFAHKGDSLVLVELYNSTEGNDWTIKTNWLQTPVSEWFGITLNADGRVIGVDLESNNLVGQLPKSIGTLAKLDSLSLPENELTGLIPPELGQLKELSFMWLSWNDLYGEIPVELAQMTQMEELHFTENSLTGQIPKELGQMANLKYLWLTGNSLSGTIPPELRHLKKIGVNANNLSGPIPTHLGEWANLIELHLCDNNFTGPIPAQLGQLSELEFLCLRNNQLSGSIPTELNQLSKLKTLWLHENHLSGPVPDLTSLTQLQSVGLQANQFLFADLLPNATLNPSLGFTYAPQDTIETQLTCRASEYVLTTPATAENNRYQWYRDDQALNGARSDTLRISVMDSPADYHATIKHDLLPDLTLVSRKANTRDASACTRIAHVADSTLLVDFYNRTHGSLLWHDHTGWLEDPVAQWYGITLDASGRVTDINLPYNNLVGQLPLSRLDQLAHLRYLNVSGNEFSGTIPEEFGALTQLEYLVLGHNKLAGTIPRELADQAPLKVLDISGNQLAGKIPTELSQIATLQTLSMSANQLSGPVPDFTGLDQLDSLHVAQNEFLFMDLLPNASLTRLDDFVYAPQDSIDTFLSRTASGFAFTTAAKAMGNRYQWYRDDQPISGPQSDTLHVSLYADPAQYHSTITNDRLPALTLVSRKKGVHDRVTMTETDFTEDSLLHQSYPNPFAEATTVAFELGAPEYVRIVVYDLLGQVVAKIADGRFAAGVHRVEFTGDHLASGQYLYRMEAGTYQATRSMSVVR